MDLWEQILDGSRARQANTEARALPLGHQRLALGLEPRRVSRLMVPRELCLIEPGLQKVLAQLVQGGAPWPLFLWGAPGAGKTCAALCLLDHACDGGYFTVGSLRQKVIDSQMGRLSWVREGYGGTIWPEDFWKGVARAGLVVLDDLGTTQKVSDPHYEAIKQLLDERQYRPLIVIANKDLQAVSLMYDDRVASRLAAGTVVHLQGEDRRVKG